MMEDNFFWAFFSGIHRLGWSQAWEDEEAGKPAPPSRSDFSEMAGWLTMAVKTSVGVLIFGGETL